jgi:low affinity Fe/Cu permease
MAFSRAFTAFAAAVAKVSGRPITFALCVVVILAWAATGPMFHYSDTWQLIINTGTTIVTFLMVFLIQNTQNRDGAAIQTKLDELIRASAAQNVYIGIEHLTEEEVEEMRTKCEARAKGGVADRAVRAADAAEQTANEKASKAAVRAVS